MKLRFPLSLQQLLFLIGGAFLLLSTAGAQDIILLTTGATQQGKILGVTPSGQLEFQVAGTTNKLGLALSSVKEVRMAAPAELATAFAQFQAKDYGRALSGVKGVVDKYKGLPVVWAQQATSMLGDLYIALNDLPKAEAAYNDFKKYYPSAGSLQSEIGLSRLAVAKKDYATAKQKLEPITAAALQEKVITPVNALAYSQAFLVSGQVKEEEGNFAGALEDYLRTVTLFYHDRAAVASAQEKADALRAAHKGVTVP
jgi:tetratricopeptide (TPR) repeat protein